MKRVLAFTLFLIVIFAACDKKDKTNNQADANFSVAGYEVPAPVTLQFLNTSSNATSYLWNFGDGATSTSFNPTHQYPLPGDFNVTLKVTGPTGTDSICKIVSVAPPVVANKSSFSYFLDKCSGYPVGAAFKTLNPASTNPVWNFAGISNVARDPNIQFLLPGDYEVKYSTMINGVRDTVMRIIRIQ
jgi:PKD repeat protein